MTEALDENRIRELSAQLIGSSPYQYDTAARQDPATLIQHIDPAALVDMLEKGWRGEVYDSKTRKWKPSDYKVINNKGINRITFYLRSIVNTNCTLSNFDEREVGELVVLAGKELACLLAMNYEEYEIKKENLSTILFLCCIVIYSALKRGYNEGERGLLTKTVVERINRSPVLTPEKRAGIFGRIFK